MLQLPGWCWSLWLSSQKIITPTTGHVNRTACGLASHQSLYPAALELIICRSVYSSNHILAVSQGLAGSIRRYVSFLQQATAGYGQDPSLVSALTAAAEGSLLMPPADDPHALAPPLLMRTRFTSLCEHHLLPFQGTLRVALCPVAGLTELAVQPAVHQLVACFSRRLQIQERLTHEVADALAPLAQQGSLLVVCDAVHMCMVARGVEQHASSTLTVAARGQFEFDAGLRAGVMRRVLAPQTP